MNDNLLNKYFSDKATSDEVDEILNWVEESNDNAAMFASKKIDWVFDHLPDKKASDYVYKEFKRKRKPHSSREIFIRVAAFLLIPISILSVIQFVLYSNKNNNTNQIIKIEIPTQYESMVTYSTNSGVKGTVNLPDGSTVWLNSCSSLKSPAKFDSTSRVVELSGEGYFKVMNNPEWPLFIKTSKGIVVKVTGTEFNLSTYEDDNVLKLTLISGNVSLIRESDNHIFNVKQNEEVIISDTFNASSKTIAANLQLTTAWKEGYLTFENTPMEEVVKKIERWYGVSITIDNPIIYDFKMTANFRSESIMQVLELLQVTSNVDYSIKDNEVKLFLR